MPLRKQFAPSSALANSDIKEIVIGVHPKGMATAVMVYLDGEDRPQRIDASAHDHKAYKNAIALTKKLLARQLGVGEE